MLTIGKTYHLYNGYAKSVDDLWINNVELSGVTQHGSGLTELLFEKDGQQISIDAETMHPWDASKKLVRRQYMFIEKA